MKEKDTFAKAVTLDNTDEFVSGTIFESLSDTTAGTSMMGRQTNRDVEESDHESETRDQSKRAEFNRARAGTSMTSDESRKTNGGNEEISHECKTSVVRDPSGGARVGRTRSRNTRGGRRQRGSSTRGRQGGRSGRQQRGKCGSVQVQRGEIQKRRRRGRI